MIQILGRKAQTVQKNALTAITPALGKFISFGDDFSKLCIFKHFSIH